MKKTILFFASIFIFSAAPTYAIDLNQVAGVVNEVAGSKPGKNSKTPLDELQNKTLGKLEERIDKVFTRVETKIDKYEKKLDNYEKKIDEVEKTVNKVNKTINNLDLSQLNKYITIAKYAAIGFVSALALLILLLILVFVQLLKVNSALRKARG